MSRTREQSTMLVLIIFWCIPTEVSVQKYLLRSADSLCRNIFYILNVKNRHAVCRYMGAQPKCRVWFSKDNNTLCRVEFGRCSFRIKVRTPPGSWLKFYVVLSVPQNYFRFSISVRSRPLPLKSSSAHFNQFPSFPCNLYIKKKSPYA
jgi:hypothetical protein